MNCLIIDEMHSSIIPLLKEAGVTPDYKPQITKEEILSIIYSYEGLIVRSKIKITEEILAGASKLKFIARAGAGMDNIDVAAAEKRGIKLINAPEGNRDALAEHAVAMILTLLNKVHTADRDVRNLLWDREGNRGYELMGKCVGIIGYGFMGKAFARRLKSFGCEVIAYDKYLKNYSDDFVKEVSMEQIFQDADILSLHIPLTSETKRMVNYSFINQFRKNIWFMNTARGEIVVTGDLIMHLESGKVKGAALDVLENEKISTLSEEQKKDFKYLSGSTKVLLTPHVGGWTYESYEKINQVLADKIKSFISTGN